jgi:hypothetical protein
MKLLDYSEYDFTQCPTVPGIQAMPIVQARPTKKIRMTWGRRQFWLRFVVVALFLFVEACALVTWGVVTNGAILPPFVEKTPIVAPCAHTTIYFGNGTLTANTNESCP